MLCVFLPARFWNGRRTINFIVLFVVLANRKLANGGSSGESCSGTETSNSENEGGFIRKRASGRRIIQSDDEVSESEVTATVNDDISDSEMADIDLDYTEPLQ